MVTYKDLKVQPFINASGTITTLGGSLMSSDVLASMSNAAEDFVDLNDLNLKAGDYLAERIGVEAAFISCGAASGVQLAAAACLTRMDRKKVEKLPQTEGWKNEFVIGLVDPHTYIHQGIEVCGGKLIRVGSSNEIMTSEILKKIGKKTAAVVHFLGKQSKAQLEEVIFQAKRSGVPVVVDAAAQLPPRSNLTEFAKMGASLVVFSGGKGMRGPQSSGLVIGEHEFVEAVRLNASPNSAIGRGMKVGKEVIMGLVAAVDLFLNGSDEEDRIAWMTQANFVVQALTGIPGVRAYVLEEGQQFSPNFVPRAYVDLEEASLGQEVVRAMREGEPSVAVLLNSKGIVVDPMTLRLGEEEMVAQRLKEVLEK